MVSENSILTTDFLTAILLNHVKSSFMASLSTCEYEESEQVTVIVILYPISPYNSLLYPLM